MSEIAGVTGGLRLVLGRNTLGRPCVISRYHAPPAHFSKPYIEGDHIRCQVTTPTAGLLAGDQMSIDVRAEAGIRASVINPALTRVHPMSKNEHATIHQQYFATDEGTLLEISGEGIQLLKDASLHQKTELRTDGRASLLYTEFIYPGRLTRGEAFCFQRLAGHLSCHVNGHYMLREVSSIDAGSRAMDAWQRRFGTSMMATVVFLSPCANEVSLEEWNFSNDNMHIGSAHHGNSTVVLKAVGKRPLVLKKQIEKFRRQLLDR